jgi:hypothetical protein
MVPIPRSFPENQSRRLGGGPNIRAVKGLLGRRDASTTMISTHLLNRGPAGAAARADRMFAP